MSDKSGAVAPRTFISYSWSSPTHESWVLALAERLMQDGVEVLLDKWDLKPGQDAQVFMEQMVSAPSVTKVLMICDRTYVEKANVRTGGVGTESQIISPKLYEDNSATQTKFAAVCTALDADGKAYVPIFYSGRIYFDFTSPDRAEIQYDELLRWLLDKPRYIKPALGSVPSSIANPEGSGTTTSSRARRVEDALRQGLSSAPGLLRDYVDAVVAELPHFKIDLQDGEHHDDAVVREVERLRPYSNEFQNIVSALVRYSPSRAIFDILLSSLEQVATFMYRPPDVNTWREDDFDAYKIFSHEIFLTTFAITLREKQFDLSSAQVNRAYFIRGLDRNAQSRSSVSFTAFCELPSALDRRSSRLNLRRQSLHADYIKEWHERHSLTFDDVMQADFVLWIASLVRLTADDWRRWYPITLVFAANRFSPFEIFARSESRAFFASLLPVLGVDGADKLRAILSDPKAGGGLSFGYHTISSQRLANIENLASLP